MSSPSDTGSPRGETEISSEKAGEEMGRAIFKKIRRQNTFSQAVGSDTWHATHVFYTFGIGYAPARRWYAEKVISLEV